MKKVGDKGSPCYIPCEVVKNGVDLPFTSTEKLLPNTCINSVLKASEDYHEEILLDPIKGLFSYQV